MGNLCNAGPLHENCASLHIDQKRLILEKSKEESAILPNVRVINVLNSGI